MIGCRPISSRLITIRLKAAPFNITIIQAYAPTVDYDDETVEDFYDQLQKVLEDTPKKDIIIVQGDWNAKVGEDANKDWNGTSGRYCNSSTNDRGLRLLEFASYNNLKLINTFGQHKASRRWTWHSPGGESHSQIDYIMVQKRFQSSANIAKTRSFPGADIGSDHDLVMMTFALRLTKNKKQNSTRIKFNLDKLNDPNVSEAFQAKLGGKFAPLLALAKEEELNSITNTFNETITEIATELLGKHRPKKKPWVTDDVLNLCDKRRELKKNKHKKDGIRKYKDANIKVKEAMKKAMESWIDNQCVEIDSNIQKNNSRKAYQMVRELTNEKRGRSTTIQNKEGKCLTEEQDILERWTQYCSELYSYETTGDQTVLNVSQSTNTSNDSILREEVITAVKALKAGKSAGVDNIPAELVKAGGDSTIDMLHLICNKIWQTGEWPKPWTQSLVITLPKKGNLQLCQNYRTISLISHPSKVMLKIILNRLKPQAEQIIAEEQAGFRSGRSTTEQIFNVRLIMEKYLQHQQQLYHVFIDFKKAFDRVWHKALWATMNLYNFNSNLIRVIENLYSKATSAVFHNNSIGEWFPTTTGVRQGCLLSPTLFNIFLEKIMTDALEQHEGTVSIGGRNITNLRFADDIDGIAGNEQELIGLINKLEQASSDHGMEISGEKTKIMTNNNFTTDIMIKDQKLEKVTQFKYLGAVVSDEGSKPEILARIAQTTAALTKLKHIWKNRNISLVSKIKLMRSLVISIFLYACESWTLTADTEKRIKSIEMRCFRKLLNISYTDHITNEEVQRRIQNAIGPYTDLLTLVKQRKLKWFGHVTRSSGLAKTILQGTVPGGRRRGRQRKRWEDNIGEWTGMEFEENLRKAESRDEWRMLVAMVQRRPNG